MNIRLFTAVASLVWLAYLGGADAQEWTRFRGPNGSGIGKAPGVPAEFSEKDFNWKIDLPGSGHSSPVIWGDRVFVTSNPKGTAKREVLCVSAANGKTLWQKEFATGDFRQHGDNSYASATPAVDAERAYFFYASPEGSGLVGLDQKDGRELWRVDLGPFVSQHGPGSSPIVFEDLVILDFDQDQPKSFLAAFDAKTGKQRWRVEHEGTASTASTPCLFQPKNGATQVVTISRTAGMRAVDARTGKPAWELAGLMPRRCVASPLVSDSGLIFGQCGEGRAESFVFAVRPAADGKSAEKVYEVVRTGGYVPTPLAVGDLLFLWKENGLVTCIRAGKNEQVWSERVEGPYYGSPVCVNGRLYNMTTKGELVVLGATEKYEKIARIPLGEGSHATPAISGGRMYLRTFAHLISVGK